MKELAQERSLHPFDIEDLTGGALVSRVGVIADEATLIGGKVDLMLGCWFILTSSPERLRVLIATRNVGLIVLVACRTKCEAVTPAAKTDLALVLYAR